MGGCISDRMLARFGRAKAESSGHSGRTFAGCFCGAWSFARNDPQTAVENAQQTYGQSRFERIVSVGDGIWDVQAATNLGIPFVGVGKGEREHSLRQAGATHVLESYSDYRQLINCLEEAEVPTTPM